MQNPPAMMNNRVTRWPPRRGQVKHMIFKKLLKSVGRMIGSCIRPKPIAPDNSPERDFYDNIKLHLQSNMGIGSDRRDKALSFIIYHVAELSILDLFF
ncbi:hypothetical protein H5410_058698 [Solanum commersonii]|uniref:Uncharacterized protein n=1 Tax=Solanum commersonii TaxID=4109 RepID=A0A9J5WTY0_SOLCO|nr:hypothetical protein H5410_058698 [Solanum commersonii]